MTEVQQSNNNIFFEDPFSEEVWQSTYKDYKDIDVMSTWDRVAKALSSVEKTTELQEKHYKEFLSSLERF